VLLLHLFLKSVVIGVIGGRLRVRPAIRVGWHSISDEAVTDCDNPGIRIYFKAHSQTNNCRSRGKFSLGTSYVPDENRRRIFSLEIAPAAWTDAREPTGGRLHFARFESTSVRWTSRRIESNPQLLYFPHE